MAQASAENLNILGLLKSKWWPQCHREREQLDKAVPQREKELVRLFFEEERIGGA